MSSGSVSPHDQGELSEDLDLLTVRQRIDTSQARAPNLSTAITALPQSQNDEEPDWVREFSQSLPSEQQRREALASQFDEEDDDSIIDLVPDEPGPLTETPSLANDAQPSQSQDVEKSQLKRPRASAAPKNQMPLVFASKLDESIILLQSADQNLDLSGDVGAVGRVKMRNGIVYLDVKGTVYKADTIACNTACVVTIGEDEAKVTAVLNEAITLVSEDKLFASNEIVVRGELEEAEGDGDVDEGISAAVEVKSKKRKPTESTEKGKKQGTSMQRPPSTVSRKVPVKNLKTKK